MGLINCPEYGKEISNKSEICIHCGCPLANYICNINGLVKMQESNCPSLAN